MMTNYRRLYLPYALYFFTVVTYQRQKFLTTKTARTCLRQSFQFAQSNRPFEVVAIVLLPDHLHTIWKLPENDFDYSTRWKLIKTNFTKMYKHYNNSLTPNISMSRLKKGEKGIWQRRYWEHVIRNEKDYANHMDYIHYNPVKHGYVQSPKDWEWSTFHQYVEKDWYDIEWGASEPKNIKNLDAGE